MPQPVPVPCERASREEAKIGDAHRALGDGVTVHEEHGRQKGGDQRDAIKRRSCGAEPSRPANGDAIGSGVWCPRHDRRFLPAALLSGKPGYPSSGTPHLPLHGCFARFAGGQPATHSLIFVLAALARSSSEWCRRWGSAGATQGAIIGVPRWPQRHVHFPLLEPDGSLTGEQSNPLVRHPPEQRLDAFAEHRMDPSGRHVRERP